MNRSDIRRSPGALTRRELMSVGLSAAALPAAACSARASPAQFTPEQFGASGDGLSDDYDAFQRLAAAINESAGGILVLRPGAHYLLNRYVSAGNGVADVTFQGCSGLAIRGNSASISVKGDFFRTALTTRSLAGLRFENCDDVQIGDLQLIGNVQQTIRTPTLTEAPSHGLLFGGCRNVVIDGVLVRHFAADGLYVRASTQADLSGRFRASSRFDVRNSKFLFNARQGLSVIQLRDAIFSGCEFSHTGYVAAPGVSGPYGVHSPGAGVDVEPNATPKIGRRVDLLTGNLSFRDCRMIGNLGKAFVVAAYTGADPVSENVSLDHCLLEADQVSTSRYGLIFDVPGGTISNCTLNMGNKTAFVGWAAQSDASLVLKGNVITGYSGGSNRPFFLLKNGRGVPLLEGNRFEGQHHQPQPGSAKGPQLVELDNSSAIVRGNYFFLPQEAYPTTATGLVPAIIARVRSMSGNRFQTDLTPGNGDRSFGVIYGDDCRAANETFHGTRPGIHDTVQPAKLRGRAGLPHDSRVPWSN